MRRTFIVAHVTLALLLTGAASVRGVQPVGDAPLAIQSGRVVVNGTSNIHAYTAESRDVRLVNVKVDTAPAGSSSFWGDIVKPGELKAFEIALRADSLHSTKDGLDKNMHKALKAEQHAEISYRLTRLEAASGATKAVGVLRVAGVEREVTLNLTFTRRAETLLVNGETQFLMTDFGITPPKAMLGMLKTDPKVSITFETVLSVPVS